MTAFEVGTVHHHLTVETTRPEQGRIENVGPVGGGDNDHPACHVETVQLDQQLVQGLLPFVMASAETGTTMATDCVDLVDKDDRRGG